ncbi:putative oxygen-independent coproporphyrinogen III oxidase [Mycolicibacterium phlei]|jgi:putative oxygen-independent coproporphyrinogen III oxidase|uniref:Heme chaperone HemW n=2 Tax=Mycolicibacterium phlei TaxID=1771 RepID=A0A5N5V671_MYCPH|nr:Oxygen-independent coproporphyrinogen-III oxidase 1 [Mycolicibacterium phlei]EID10265.1 coproporphyrinogen III oxidase [Mycolicibacterium phlei RIVM601174]KAB7757371.1 coproporphyrinogen III oxidase [Mycolicibacterium phlei DSM 43239 = CCUG 21000]VEG10402.1 putative oxygen-independent coproporphyrinogen III oxidase [Mycobacteroides chelonae]KXW66268.1 coproporphyrinogen III oxidase [Mycolicibacterium phlei DSM 43239 = CCUG 21000]
MSKTAVWDTGLMTARTAPAAPPALRPVPGRPFGVYIHVPFCATRCGYCDFNTYTAAELGGASTDGWLAALRTELTLAAAHLDTLPTVQTVFVGGGTPSLLGADGLRAVLDAVRAHFTLAPDAEVTTEANPESTSPALFEALLAAGYTRISLGMQSTAPHVLATLDRTHRPGRALDAAREALAAGFTHVSLDLIYGTPGESDDDLLRSVDAALGTGIDHLSAYALVVEDGTAMARRVRRGELTPPDDDVLARRYELLDARLRAAGFDWYEVSNWSRPGGRCRHNIGYWDGGEWWGAGPGAHGFVGDVRWWNVKHPNTYAQTLADGALPVADFEQLDAATMHIEDVMLRVRLRDGLPLQLLSDSERARADAVVAAGLLTRTGDRLVLTDRGRLLADAVVRDLID